MSETIQRTKLYEDVTERMLDHIRTETWAPGTKIPPEVELAKLFDVSRCTIREAVKSLQIAGFLRSRAGSGTFVSERAPTLLQTQALAGIMADPAALRELVQARYILEPQLAQMAAQAATEEEIRGLFAILDRMKRGQTRFELMSVGHQFHLSLAQLAHNRVLYGFYVSAASQMRSMRVLESLTLEVYRSGIHFTPLLSDTVIDARGVRDIVAEEYRRRCAAHGWAFLDAEGVAEFNKVDYMHLSRLGHSQLAAALAPLVRELT